MITWHLHCFFTIIPIYIIGFIGNVLVIRIVHKTREMHTTTNYLLVNLAFCDTINVFTGPLFFFSHLNGYLSDGFGKFVCKFLPLTKISIVVSSFNLTVLAVERYHALLKPFRTGLRIKDENIKQVVALIWISSLLLCVPFFVFKKWSESQSTCIGPRSLHMNLATKVYTFIIVAFAICIPLSIVLYFYGCLIKGLYFTNMVCPETEGRRRREKRDLLSHLLRPLLDLLSVMDHLRFYSQL